MQVQRPPSAKACSHRLIPEVESTVMKGEATAEMLNNPSRKMIQVLPYGFANTKLWKSPGCDVQAACWGTQVLVTSDFISSVVRSSKDENFDEFLRPPAWVVSLRRNPKEVCLLLISPFEANELIPKFRTGEMKSILHMYSPRLIAVQKDVLIDKESLNLPPVPVTIPNEVRVPLSLFAGTLYFQDAEEETAFADFLGITPRQGRTEEQRAAFGQGKLSKNGFVMPEYRQELMGKSSGFIKNPHQLVKEILRTRNQGNIPEESHVAKLAVDGMCSFRKD
jgi:hypothetical protein